MAVRSAVAERRCNRGSGSRSGARQRETIQHGACAFNTQKSARRAVDQPIDDVAVLGLPPRVRGVGDVELHPRAVWQRRTPAQAGNARHGAAAVPPWTRTISVCAISNTWHRCFDVHARVPASQLQCMHMLSWIAMAVLCSAVRTRARTHRSRWSRRAGLAGTVRAPGVRGPRS